MRLSGKVAVVLGGATGHEPTSAIRLADEGARVRIVSTESPHRDELEQHVRKRGVEAIAYTAQPDGFAELHAIAAGVAEESRHVPVLVNHYARTA